MFSPSGMSSVIARSRIFRAGVVLALVSLVVGCAETELAIHAAKQLRGATAKPGYKVGEPYQVRGVFYYPAVDYNYRETGVASWYGSKFHGRSTANGEVFDMNAVTAAHRTLPLPSIVRVQNLENGRTLVVRVNDRGPFARGRIIDLSRRAAQLLGFRYKGTALVRVEILANESRRVAMLTERPELVGGVGLVGGGAAANGAVVTQETVLPIDGLGPALGFRPTTLRPTTARPARIRPVVARFPAPAAGGKATANGHDIIGKRPVKVNSLYIQVGSYIRRANARRARARLDRYGRTRVETARVGNERFFRVRVGPIASIAEADGLLARVIASGYPKARFVVD